MSWDFSTDPEFEAHLAWMEAFVTHECEPLDLAFPGREYERPTPEIRAIIDPLKEQVRARGLWACHLGPELGGMGYGQVQLALMNEIMGRSFWAPIIFGAQAPDTGNAEIIAHFGTVEQQTRYLEPLLAGSIFSTYSMTEPHGGSDPKVFTTTAVRDGEEWVISGEKWFSSNARSAEFFIVMAVSNPDVPVYEGMSMFLVPSDTPGIEILQNIETMWEEPGQGKHAWVRYNDVRVGRDALLGEEGKAFAVAQFRLGGGRVHHAMRTVAKCRVALDMACERAKSRNTQGTALADKQLVKAQISDAWTQLTQFRLLVLYTAWLIDQGTTDGARREIAACKVEASRVLHDIVRMSAHIHGSLGVTKDTPLAGLWQYALSMGVTDGPTEVHQMTIAKEVLREYEPAPGLFPTEYLPPKIAAARAKYAEAADETEEASV